MSVFIGSNISNDDGESVEYIYDRNGKKYIIRSGMLNWLFKTYGYCVDPGERNPIPLKSQSLDKLKELAREQHDKLLLETIEIVQKKRGNPPIIYKRNCNFDETKLFMMTTLKIGMYLAGWKGPEEPYIISPRPLYDSVRLELKMQPLIESLYANSNYSSIKKMPIVAYFQSIPFIIDDNLNIEECLNQIKSRLVINDIVLKEVSSRLISTSYYYITELCDTPLPMLKPLIQNVSF